MQILAKRLFLLLTLLPSLIIIRQFFTPKTDYGIYLDYTGAGRFTENQLNRAHELITDRLYCNPHSQSICSQNSEEMINLVKNKVLDLFNVTSDEYSVIFTSGATGALKIVADSFAWNNNSKFVYLTDNHNSVIGIKHVAKRFGASVNSVTQEQVEFKGSAFLANPDKPALFAYPAQSNFHGRKYPLSWLKDENKNKLSFEGIDRDYKWYTLLDAAAFVPSSRLSLKEYPADFVPVSFYKIFGYPTGLGALLVRKSAQDVIHKCYRGGGSITVTSCNEGCDFTLDKPDFEEAYQDGTVAFLSIIELLAGFEEMEKLGWENVYQNVKDMRTRAFNQVVSLTHSTGQRFLEIYGSCDPAQQGGILSFNVYKENGEFHGPVEISSLAAKSNIHIRAGMQCNLGAFLNDALIPIEKVRDGFYARTSCGDANDMIDNHPLGAVRVSFGAYTTAKEVDFFVNWLKENYLK